MSQKLFPNPLQDYVLVKNVVFDYIMPTLSGDAWKALCVVIRRTCNVTMPDDADVWVNLSEVMQNAGLPERTEAEMALQECVYAGYMVAHPENKTSSQPSYGLNVQYELPTTAAEPAPRTSRATTAPKSTPAPAAESAPPSTLPADKQMAYDSLCQFGQEMGVTFDPQVVQQAVAKNTVDDITSWIKLGQGMTHLDKAARFQMALDRLLAGVPPMPLSMLAPDDGSADAAEPALAATSTPPAASGVQAEELWTATLKALRPQMRSSLFKWFKPTEAIDIQGNTLRVSVSNTRTKDWLETGQLAETIVETFDEVSGGGMTLVFEAES